METCLNDRDLRVANKVRVILEPGLVASVVLAIVRLTERGTVAEKIRKLKFLKPAFDPKRGTVSPDLSS